MSCACNHSLLTALHSKPLSLGACSACWGLFRLGGVSQDFYKATSALCCTDWTACHAVHTSMLHFCCSPPPASLPCSSPGFAVAVCFPSVLLGVSKFCRVRRTSAHAYPHRSAQHSLKQAIPSCNTYRAIPGSVLETHEKSCAHLSSRCPPLHRHSVDVGTAASWVVLSCEVPVFYSRTPAVYEDAEVLTCAAQTDLEHDVARDTQAHDKGPPARERHHHSCLPG